MAKANYHDIRQTETLEYVCRETLNRARGVLEEDFDPLLVQNELRRNEILTEKECEELKCKTRRRDRLNFFFTLLKSRYQTFHKFIEVLKNFKGYEALGSNLADQSLKLKLYIEKVKDASTKSQMNNENITSKDLPTDGASTVTSNTGSGTTTVDTSNDFEEDASTKSQMTNENTTSKDLPIDEASTVTSNTGRGSTTVNTSNDSEEDGASTVTSNTGSETTAVDTFNDSVEVDNKQQPEDQNNTNSRDNALITQRRTADQYEEFVRCLGLTMEKQISLVDSLVINESDIKGYSEEKEASPVFNVLSKLTCFDHRIQINALPSREDHPSNLNSNFQTARETELNPEFKSKRDEPEKYYDALESLESETNSSYASNTGDSEDSQLSSDDEDSICDSNGNAISFRDGIYGIINSLDPFLLQDVIWKMSACQMAVPLLMPDPVSEKVSILLWGLRKIKKSWYVHDEAKIRTENVVDFPFLTVSALRIGKINQSKSNILNKLLGSCQGNQDNPYFSSYEQDSVTSFWSKGEVEAVWFLPNEDSRRDQIVSPFCILNLRGDALLFKTQVKFAVKASFAIIVFLDCNCSTYQEILDDMKSSCHLIIVNCNQNVDHSKGSTSKRKRKKCYEDRTELFTNGLSPLAVGKLLSKILQKILKMNENLKTSLIDSLTFCDSLNIKVDEQNSACQEGKKLASKVFNDLVEGNNQISKEEVFPIQYCWKKFTKGKTSLSTGTEEQIAARDKELKNTRVEQLSSKFSPNVMNFYKGVTSPKTKKQYFLGWLEIFLEDLTVMTIQPLYEKLKELSKTKQVTDTTSNEQSEQDTSLALKAREKLNIIQQFDEKSIGIEHFFRELAQLSEAYSHLNLETLSLKTAPPISEEELSKLPEVAAQLLLSGYTIELLDGDSNNLPLGWTENIFSAVSRLVGSDTRVYVLSVLGVQSSGKSTLLNAMFGVRFPVSAGRCTRGAFLQLLPIQDRLKKFLRCDYIAIVDTEGLKAPEKSITFSATSEDNALATFALCISDLTLINIGGQTVGEDMTNILQIAAHAFIRMKEVNLNSECRIVQQFVADVTATNKNEAATQSIVMKLDEAVRDAANLEGKGHIYRQFTDVFTLQNMEKETTNVQYIPSLWRGYMEVPNSQYGISIQSLKSAILKGMRKNTCLTITELGTRIGDVWHAIATENFVFSFQNTKEATLYDTFQSQYRMWLIPIRSKILEMRLAACAAIKSSKDCQMRITQAKKVQEISNILEKECEQVKGKIVAELEQEKYLPIKKHEIYFKSDLSIFQSNVLRYAQSEIAAFTEVTSRRTEKDPIVNKICKEFRIYSASIAQKLKAKVLKQVEDKLTSTSTESSTQIIDREFAVIWTTWIEKLREEHPLRTIKEIRSQLWTTIKDSLSAETHNTAVGASDMLRNPQNAQVNLTFGNDFKQCALEKLKSENSEHLATLRTKFESFAKDYTNFSKHTQAVLDETRKYLNKFKVKFGRTNFYLHLCSLFVEIAYKVQRKAEVEVLMNTSHKSTSKKLNTHDEVVENNIKLGLLMTADLSLEEEQYKLLSKLISSPNAEEKSKWKLLKKFLPSKDNKEVEIKTINQKCTEKLDDMSYSNKNICSEELVNQYVKGVIPLLKNIKSEENLGAAINCIISTGLTYFSACHKTCIMEEVTNPEYVAKFTEPKTLFSLQSKIAYVRKMIFKKKLVTDEDAFSTYFSSKHISKLSSLPTSTKVLQLLDLKFVDNLPNASFSLNDLYRIHNSMNDAKEKLLRHEQGLAPFNQTLFAETIAELSKLEVEKNKNEVKSAAILHIGEWVWSISADKTYEYEKSQNIVTLIERERSSLQRFFQSLCYDHEDKITAEQFCSEIVRPCILDGSIVKMLPLLLSKITNQYQEFISKRKFIGKVLESLHADYEGIIDFLRSFSKFGEKWTLNHVAEICSSNEAISLASLCQKCLEDLIDSAIDSIKTCQETFQTQSDTQMGNWLQLFSDLFHENTGLECNKKEIDKLVQHFEVRKFDIFAKECQEIIKKMNGLISEMKLPPKNDIQSTQMWFSQFAPTFHIELFECIKGCPEQCPFCGAVCDETLTEHSKHSALLHYPRGIKGRYFKDSELLVPLICTSGVESTDQGYYTIHGDPEIRLYKDYEQDYPTWYIRGVKDHQPLQFWKYVFFKYNEKIAESYNLKKAKLPDEWGEIRYDEALQSLRKAYNLSSK